jgi:Tfp pilus assembly protein PilX
MRPRRARARDGEHGFVLVGVVMFVVVLTIIGLSLFSISGYEAQFLQRSLDGEQAFQSAVGGLERAKFVLCATSRLESAGQYLPLENVISATATQVQNGNSLTSGPVAWVPSETVTLRVTAEVNGQQRTVDGTFAPKQAQNYYRQLVTVPDSLNVLGVGDVPATSRAGTVTLNGSVWVTSGQDTMSWEQWLAQPWPSPLWTRPAIPPPDADNFILQHANANAPDIDSTGGHWTYTLDGGTSAPVYVTSDDATNQSWSLQDKHPTGDVSIQVHGCAVWLFPRGVIFWHPPTITGTTGMDCLVIVAGRQGPDDDPLVQSDMAGIVFEGGLNASIPVILVTSGEAILWRNNDYLASDPNSVVGDLCVYAQRATFMGPTAGGGSSHMYLDHPVNGLLNGYFVDFLLDHDALPNANSSSGHSLALVSGTWHASTP